MEIVGQMAPVHMMDGGVAEALGEEFDAESESMTDQQEEETKVSYKLIRIIKSVFVLPCYVFTIHSCIFPCYPLHSILNEKSSAFLST